jgi:hypothetical protein
LNPKVTLLMRRRMEEQLLMLLFHLSTFHHHTEMLPSQLMSTARPEFASLAVCVGSRY